MDANHITVYCRTNDKVLVHIAESNLITERFCYQDFYMHIEVLFLVIYLFYDIIKCKILSDMFCYILSILETSTALFSVCKL